MCDRQNQTMDSCYKQMGMTIHKKSIDWIYYGGACDPCIHYDVLKCLLCLATWTHKTDQP